MISLVDDVLFFHAQRVPLAGPKPDCMAQRGARQSRLSMPHDLVSRVWIVLPVPVSAQMRDQAHGVADASPGSSPSSGSFR